MLDWSDLPILIAISETGSFTAAAQRLNVSQPTIGRRMKALEDRLGAPLTARENGALELTPFGLLVLEHARRMQDEAAAIARAAAGRDHSFAGPVVFSASESIGAEWLPRALRDFQARNRNIQITINIDNAPANLAQRQADIALRWGGPGEQQSLIGRRGASIGAGLYAAKAYLDARGRPKRPADLANHDAVSLAFTQPFVWGPEISGEEAIPSKITFSSNSSNAHIAAIRAGYGIGAYTHRMARRMPELERVLPEVETTLDLWVVVHEDVRKSARIRAAFDHVIGALETDRAHFARGEPSVIA
ncbi:MAG: LysR family transcriptional regulator [Maricaulaceae bacterium]|nr:LysR family transcriptional regulator [Maricaulaceae bacterium]